ncbi:MAG: response regulator, partial [Alphaproteobacteria bacterium]|nr:response regulator [Alphaproteobacteria bacterium]
MSVEYDLPSIKLLLVDDDTFLTEVITSQLQQEGIGEILSSANINDAKKLVPSFEPDILLLDVNLPDGSGIDLCNFLRQTGFEKPIIMLTGKGSENDVINGLNAGANDCITKPVRLGELLDRVRAQLRQFKSSDAARFTIGPLEFTPA